MRMINALNEELIDLREATVLPPFRRRGKPAHIASIYRYVQRGARAVNGERVRLETIRTPSGMKTSREAVERFLHALTYGEVTATAAVTHSREHERAEAELLAAGI
jgi:hypothetical protein